MVKKMRTIHDMAISDHNPKEIFIRRRRMRPIPKTKKPTIGWEKLQEENTREMYREATARKLQEREEEIQEGSENWKLVLEVMMSAAEEVCRRRRRTVANLWIVGREDQLRALHDVISRSVQRRNAAEETRLTSSGNLQVERPAGRNPVWVEEDSLRCKWEGCGKLCISKGGLAIHVRRMHDSAKERLSFSCGLWVRGSTTTEPREGMGRDCSIDKRDESL